MTPRPRPRPRPRVGVLPTPVLIRQKGTIKSNSHLAAVMTPSPWEDPRREAFMSGIQEKENKRLNSHNFNNYLISLPSLKCFFF